MMAVSSSESKMVDDPVPSTAAAETDDDADDNDDDNDDDDDSNINKAADDMAATTKKAKADLKEFLATFSAYDLIDPNKPWVLVPNGSFLGAFDFVPSVFRVGPWAMLPTLYIVGVIYVVLLGGVYNYTSNTTSTMATNSGLPSGYYEAFTAPWYLNLACLGWTSYVYRDLFVSGLGWGALTTFTVQSYSWITLRFLLSTLVPFFPFLAVYNELLRYPVLSQATITFIVWNFILFPVIFVCIQDQAKRKAFLAYVTNFRLLQLHFFHMFLATFSGVCGTPQRSLFWTDLYSSLTLGLFYVLFYILILDRLGMHFYMIFSPRTNLAIPSWSLVIGSTVGLYSFWNRVIGKYGNIWDADDINNKNNLQDDGYKWITDSIAASSVWSNVTGKAANLA